MPRLWRGCWNLILAGKKDRASRTFARLRLEALEDRLPPAHNITIQAGGAALLSNPGLSSFANTNDYVIDPSQFSSATSDVTLQANNDVIFKGAVNVPYGHSLQVFAGRNVTVETNVFTNGAELDVVANDSAQYGVTESDRDAGYYPGTKEPHTENHEKHE